MGNKAPNQAYEKMTFTFKGKKYEQKNGEEVVEAGTQDLDPSKSPKHMDVSVTDGETKGQKQLAIYEIDGDTCKMCFAQHDTKDRPSKFDTNVFRVEAEEITHSPLNIKGCPLGQPFMRLSRVAALFESYTGYDVRFYVLP